MPSVETVPDVPVTIESKIVEAQAAGFMFGADPLEVGKAMRKSWPPTPESLNELREKMRKRASAKPSERPPFKTKGPGK